MTTKEMQTIWNEGLNLVRSNSEKLNELRLAKTNKINSLAYYLLSGKPVSGRTMVELFNIYSYRDAIYRLKEKGYEFKSKTINNKGVTHEVWWLSMFSEEFVRMVDCTIW